MKIFPRVVDVANGDEIATFKIKNTATDDRVLLYKIRRSEPKLVEFSPKRGIVEPGMTQHISLKLSSPNVTHARLLIKLVTLRRSKLTIDFTASWGTGAQQGIVKKVVDIRNERFANRCLGDDLSVSAASEDVLNFHAKSERTRSNSDLSESNTCPSQSGHIFPSSSTVMDDDEDNDSLSNSLARALTTHAAPQDQQILINNILRHVSLSGIDHNDSDATKSLLIGVGLGLGVAMAPGRSPGDKQQVTQAQLAAAMGKVLADERKLQEVLNDPAYATSDPLSGAFARADDHGGPYDEYEHGDRGSALDRTSTYLARSIDSGVQSMSSVAMGSGSAASQSILSLSQPQHPSHGPSQQVRDRSAPVATNVSAARGRLYAAQGALGGHGSTGAHPSGNGDAALSPHSRLIAEGSGVSLPLTAPALADLVAVPDADTDREREERERRHRKGLILECSILRIFSGGKGAPRGVASSIGARMSLGTPTPVTPTGGASAHHSKGVHGQDGSDGAVIVIAGPSASDVIVKEAVETRSMEAIDSRKKIVCVEVSAASITSLRDSLCGAFSNPLPNLDINPNPNPLHSSEALVDVREGHRGSTGTETMTDGGDAGKVARLQSHILDESLRHVTITDTTLPSLQHAINRFHNLVTLDLSGNKISSIEYPLVLPNLQRLDLSGNNLRSLEGVESLTNLRSLNASCNHLVSLVTSVNILVPLAQSLSSLDLAVNPICGAMRYAEEVLGVLPLLRLFDGRDLRTLSPSYSNNSTNSYASATTLNSSFHNSHSSTPRRRPTRSHSTPRSVKAAPIGKGKGEGNGGHAPPLPQELNSSCMQDASYNDTMNDHSGSGLGFGNYSAIMGPSSGHSPLTDEKHEAEFDERLRRAVRRRDRDGEVRSRGMRAHTHSRSGIGGGGGGGGGRGRSNNDSVSGSPSASASDVDEAELLAMQRNRDKYARAALEKQRQRKRQHNASARVASPLATPENTLTQRSADSTQHGRTRDHGSVERPAASDDVVGSGEHQQRDNGDEGNEGDEDVEGGGGDLGAGQGERSGEGEMPLSSSTGALRPPKHPNRDSGRGISPSSQPSSASMVSSSLLRPTAGLATRFHQNGTLRNLSSSFDDWGTMSIRRDADYDQNKSISHDRGYHSDGDAHADWLHSRSVDATMRSMRSIRSAATSKLDPDMLVEMQEDEKYSIWHPRYRVPAPVFGHSKPFIYRRKPTLRDPPAPLTEESIQRMRRSFEKMPVRGTFSRASRGLAAGWYPMDYEEVEYIRRRSHFSDTIGSAPKPRQVPHGAEDRPQSVNTDAPSTTKTSTTLILPSKKGRREALGSHRSRLFKDMDRGMAAVRSSLPQDTFSGYKKWHPELHATSDSHGNSNSSFLHSMSGKDVDDSAVAAPRSSASGKGGDEGCGPAEVPRAGESGGRRAQQSMNATAAISSGKKKGRTFESVLEETRRLGRPPQTAEEHDSYNVFLSQFVSLMADEMMAGCDDPAEGADIGVEGALQRVVETQEKVARGEDRVAQEEQQLADYLAWLEQQTGIHIGTDGPGASNHAEGAEEAKTEQKNKTGPVASSSAALGTSHSSLDSSGYHATATLGDDEAHVGRTKEEEADEVLDAPTDLAEETGTGPRGRRDDVHERRGMTAGREGTEGGDARTPGGHDTVMRRRSRSTGSAVARGIYEWEQRSAQAQAQAQAPSLSSRQRTHSAGTPHATAPQHNAHDGDLGDDALEMGEPNKYLMRLSTMSLEAFTSEEGDAGGEGRGVVGGVAGTGESHQGHRSQIDGDLPLPDLTASLSPTRTSSGAMASGERWGRDMPPLRHPRAAAMMPEQQQQHQQSIDAASDGFQVNPLRKILGSRTSLTASFPPNGSLFGSSF